jgi:hypothetical protein
MVKPTMREKRRGSELVENVALSRVKNTVRRNESGR